MNHIASTALSNSFGPVMNAVQAFYDALNAQVAVMVKNNVPADEIAEFIGREHNHLFAGVNEVTQAGLGAAMTKAGR